MVLVMYGVALLIVFTAVASAAMKDAHLAEAVTNTKSKQESPSMDRAIEVWEGEGGARRWVVSQVAQKTRHHRTLWIGVLYAMTIVVVLVVVAKLY